MNQFQRETRYAVFKLKYLTEEQKQRLYEFSMELGPYNSVKECVVVESDWPNYEDTWAAIQAVQNGCYVPTAQMPDGMTLLGRRITELTAQLHSATTTRDALNGTCQLQEQNISRLNEEIRQANEEIKALKLHIEAMRGVITNAVNVIDLIPEGQAAAVYQMEAVLRSSPEQDLAAHDVKVSAKAISEFLSWATVNVDPEFAEWQDFADKYAAELTGKTEISHLLEAYDGYPLINHLVRQIAFSQKAFGPGLRTRGILDHIAKELKEVAENPHDLSEWIDVAMLALDGAWRHASRDGVSDEEIAKQVVDTLQAKLAKNEKRDWPDWRLLGEDKAIEHNRDEKAGA